MHRKVISLILMIFLLMQPFVYAEELSLETKNIITKYVVHPNLGREHLIDPSNNFYYVVYQKAGKFLKTEEYRTADDRLMRIAYPDRAIVVIDTMQLSEDKIKEYCEKYGFTPKKEEVVVTEKRYETLLKELAKDKQITTFVNTYVKVGYYFSVDERMNELLSIFLGLEEDDFRANPFSKYDMSQIASIEREVRLIGGSIEIMIVPYTSKYNLKGSIFEVNNDKVIILFNNDKVSLKTQFETQLRLLNEL